MTSVIQLAGWEAKGLRCPDHSVSFEAPEGGVHRISLLQMPNGTGKTTTLTLLRAALSGCGPDGGWVPQSVREMRKNASTASGSFAVRLLHNTKLITIKISFNFEEGEAAYSTTRQAGQRSAFDPPRDLKRFLHPAFVSFFVFDGELATSLLDSTKSNAEQVVYDLFQLSLFEQLERWVDTYWKDRTAAKAKVASTSSKSEKGLSKWTGWIQRYEARIEKLEAEQGGLRTELEKCKQRLGNWKRQYSDAIKANSDFSERMKAAENHLLAAEAAVSERGSSVLAMFRNPHALSSVFAREMLDFKSSLDRVKLPESSAREFFDELAREEVCVCGRELDQAARTRIRECAHRYLGTDDIALLNNLKSEVAAQLGDAPGAHAEQLDEELELLCDSISKEQLARTERDAIGTEAEHADPALEQRHVDIVQLALKVQELQEQVRRFDDTADGHEIEETWGIAVLKVKLEKAKTTVAEIVDTLTLKKRCEVLRRIIREAKVDAHKRFGEAICAQANERIRQLMPNNDTFIDRIDRCLRLRAKGGGSAGETLAVAYAFLATLFDRSEHKLPFVVDSPAGPLDHPKRAAIAKLIPRLTNQFVAFTISTERAFFQDKLESACRGAVQYLTLFRKGSRELERQAKRYSSHETEDGVLVENRTFFEGFQLEEEV